MAFVVTIAGSPSASSKLAALMSVVRQRLEAQGVETASIVVRDLNPADLLYARMDSPALQETFELVQRAQGIVVATPIYKAAYSGVLKTYLDVLPANAFAGKVVLPLASGGSPAHNLAIDYALRPVLVAVGSPHVLPGVYLVDSQFVQSEGGPTLDANTDERLTGAVHELARIVTSAERGTKNIEV
jgi:FMN reductase